jgi:hypothetical protein
MAAANGRTPWPEVDFDERGVQSGVVLHRSATAGTASPVTKNLTDSTTFRPFLRNGWKLA